MTRTAPNGGRRPRRWPLLLLLLAGALAAAGALGGGTRASGARKTASPAPALVPGTGGTATVDVPAVPTTLNPHTVAGATSATAAVADAVWPQVFQVGPGLVPTLDTDVVQSAEVVGVSPQTVVYRINPAAVWSDGVAVTADDFVYAWHLQAGGAVDVGGAPASVASELGYRDIASVTGSDGGRTVTVVFRTPYADWAALFSSLLPAHIAARAGWNTGFDRFDPAVLVSGGPWMVQAWTPGQRLVLARNPRWWGATPPLDQLVLQAAPAAAATADLRAGTAQVASITAFDSTTLAAVSADPSLFSSVSPGTTLLQLAVNTAHGPLADAQARQGIAHLVDRTALVDDVGRPVDAAILPAGDHLMSNLHPGYANDGGAYQQTDVAAGDRLLAAAGWNRGTGGWTFAGTPVTLTLVWAADDPWSAATGPLLAAQLEGQGIAVQTRTVTAAALAGQVLPQGTYDLALVPVPTGAYVSATAAWWEPGQPTGPPAVDLGALDDPRVDQLYMQADQDLNPGRALGLYRQLDQLLWQDMAALPLFAEPRLAVQSAGLTGIQDDPGGVGILFGAATWAPLVAGPPGAEPSTLPTTSTTVARG